MYISGATGLTDTEANKTVDKNQWLKIAKCWSG